MKPSVSCGAKKLSRRAKNAGNVYIVWPYQRGNHRDPFTQDMLKLIRIQNQTVEQNVREHGRVTLTNSFLMMSLFYFFQFNLSYPDSFCSLEPEFDLQNSSIIRRMKFIVERTTKQYEPFRKSPPYLEIDG